MEVELEETLGKLLIEKGLTISTAESCTGGMIASKLVNYPGISSAFMESAVTYSNAAKIHRLNVSVATLEKYGAVSEETAKEMAFGIASTSGTDIGISVTGIAGPDGGTLEKPVGLVYVGLYLKGEIMAKELRLSGDRYSIRSQTTLIALEWLIAKLNSSP